MTPESREGAGTAVSLSALAEGAAARLVAVEGGAGLRSRLVAIGLRPGADLTVVRNGGHGPCVVALGTCRIVLGRGMAHRVMVIPIEVGHDAGP